MCSNEATPQFRRQSARVRFQEVELRRIHIPFDDRRQVQGGQQAAGGVRLRPKQAPAPARQEGRRGAHVQQGPGRHDAAERDRQDQPAREAAHGRRGVLGECGEGQPAPLARRDAHLHARGPRGRPGAAEEEVRVRPRGLRDPLAPRLAPLQTAHHPAHVPAAGGRRRRAVRAHLPPTPLRQGAGSNWKNKNATKRSK